MFPDVWGQFSKSLDEKTLIELLDTSLSCMYTEEVKVLIVSIQAIQTNMHNSKKRGPSKSEERDKKLTMMVALMVRLLGLVQSLITILTDSIIPPYMVSICMCLYSGDNRILSKINHLLLHPWHPNYAHKDLCVYQSHHLLLDEPSVPNWNVCLVPTLTERKW